MADPVAAPAAPSAPAAAPLKANEAFVPFEIGNMDHETTVEDDGVVDTPPEETTEGEPAPVDTPPAPTRLQKFRNADGTLNEDLLEQVTQSAEEAGATVGEIQRAYNSDPTFRLAYIKWRQSTGQSLEPAQLAELTAAKPPETTKPPEPKYTMEQLTAHYNKLYAGDPERGVAGDPGQAQRFWHEFVTVPELKKRDDALAERDAKDAKRTEEAKQTAHMQQIRGELAAAASQYKDLVVADPSLPQGYRITNEKVFNEVRKLMAIPGETMASRIDLALYRLKMQPPQKAATKPGAKPTVPVSTARTAPQPRKLKPNEFAMPAFIVGDEQFQ